MFFVKKVKKFCSYSPPEKEEDQKTLPTNVNSQYRRECSICFSYKDASEFKDLRMHGCTCPVPNCCASCILDWVQQSTGKLDEWTCSHCQNTISVKHAADVRCDVTESERLPSFEVAAEPTRALPPAIYIWGSGILETRLFFAEVFKNPMVFGFPAINDTTKCKCCNAFVENSHALKFGMGLGDYVTLFNNNDVPTSMRNALIADPNAAVSWTYHSYQCC